MEGIQIVNSVSILGMKIDRKLEYLDMNWDNAISKMRKLSGYWTTFGLSITGRIMVCKTYILAQSVYLMSLLPLADRIADEINNLLVEFISGTDRPIERRRQFLKAELGGYDMFDVRDMETSIKATWIGRWKKENEKPDYSGALILRGREMMADRIGVDTAMIGNNVILRNIVDRWEFFKRKFYEIGNNVLESPLFGNPTHGRENILAEVVVFGREGAGNLGERTLNIRVRELLNAQCQVKEKREVGMLFDREPNWAEYFRLRELITRIKQDYIDGERKSIRS